MAWHIHKGVGAALLLACCSWADAQTAARPFQARQAAGSLTVTATVVSSVGVVTGPNGEQTLIFANAPDSRDNVSSLVREQARKQGANPLPAAKPRKTR